MMIIEPQRYSCQMALPGFGEVAQGLLQQSKVLIVGAGGLGCPAAQYLAAAGVGTLGIADDDIISLSNLHRQILYTPAELGGKKAIIAARKLQDQNPKIRVLPIIEKVTSENVLEIIEPYDLVLDGTDNFDTKYLLSDACVLTGKPLIYGAIYQYQGQVAVWNVRREDGTFSPHYRDLFPEIDGSRIPNCAEGGVIPTLAGIIGCLQANEALKYLTRTAETLAGKLLILDAGTLQTQIIRIGEISQVKVRGLIPTSEVPTLTAKELQQGMEDDRFDLIDIRSEAEHESFDIGGMWIPLEDLEQNMDWMEGPKPKVFYCATGSRSGAIVKQLKKKYPQREIYSLSGGLKSWLEQG
ncbi:MAG: ThiF family adenylyltransferase [Chitinophagaceae bacterium]